jgi:N6-L-threonylcarbamoyladenine synthase
MKVLPGLVNEVLLSGGMNSLEGIDVFAATAGPGLTGSLLVGLAWSKAAAWAACKPFLGINHLAAHLYIHYGQNRQVIFPAVALLVSGGHTSLFRMNSWHEILLLGSTISPLTAATQRTVLFRLPWLIQRCPSSVSADSRQLQNCYGRRE